MTFILLETRNFRMLINSGVIMLSQKKEKNCTALKRSLTPKLKWRVLPELGCTVLSQAKMWRKFYVKKKNPSIVGKAAMAHSQGGKYCTYLLFSKESPGIWALWLI